MNNKINVMASNRMLISSKESWREIIAEMKNQKAIKMIANEMLINLNPKHRSNLYFKLLKLDLSIEEKLKDN